MHTTHGTRAGSHDLPLAEIGTVPWDSDPAISVVIPTFNRASLTLRAIRSVLAQSFVDFEVIVVDDASTDETAEAIRTIDDSRVRLVSLDVNLGNAGARNAGVQATRAALIAFLDSDDEYMPDALSCLHAALSGTPDQIGFAWADRISKFSDGRSQLEVTPDVPLETDDHSRYLSFLHQFRAGTNSGLTVKRSCFYQLGGFDECLKAAVDTDFVLRLVRAYRGVKVSKPLVIFHHHDGPRTSRGIAHKAAAYVAIIEKHYDALASDHALWTKYQYRAARLHYHAGDRVRGRKHISRVFSRNPLNLKVWLAFFAFELLGRWSRAFHKQISILKKQIARHVREKRDAVVNESLPL